MRITKLITALVLTGGLASSCIERYFPESGIDFVPKLVIDATITPDEGEQMIIISESSAPEKNEFNPVSGCTVVVEDDQGNNFPFHESDKSGYYRGEIAGQFVIIGSQYRLSVLTPDGKKYLSQFEELLPCPNVDSVYYELNSKQTNDPEVSENGLQFYIDFNGGENSGNYFRWQLVETYEYHSTWPLDKWLDWDGNHDLPRPDYSNFICYKTDSLGSIYTLSTKGFTQNSYTKYKLHFVNDHTQRLLYKYSLLVKQHSLTESAYNYWYTLKKNNQETANLFGRQPANVKGNICNVNDTTDLALGYFSVSTVSTKRIIINSVKELSFKQVFRCRARIIDGPLPPDDRPIYFATDYDAGGNTYLGIAGPECIFCTMNGGTTVKPSYWDTK